MQREFHSGEDAGTLVGWYQQLADACAVDKRLDDVLEVEARAAEEADVAKARDATPDASSGLWMRSVTAIEEFHEFARLVEALIDIGEVTREEAGRLFSERAQKLGTYAAVVSADQKAARRHLENVWESLSWMSQRDVPEALVGVGALDPGELDAWQRRMRPGPWESDEFEAGGIGEPVERWVGPAERRCGVRVLAVERCSGGIIVHLHLARASRDDDGHWPEMPDEVVGSSARDWPGFPRLWLEDDAGTRYQGGVAPDDVADARDSSLETEAEARFSPAISNETTGLRLVSDDPQVRFTLR
jgi:hypothetical protein